MWKHSPGEPWFAGQAWRHRCRDWTCGRGGAREGGGTGRLGPTYTPCVRERAGGARPQSPGAQPAPWGDQRVGADGGGPRGGGQTCAYGCLSLLAAEANAHCQAIVLQLKKGRKAFLKRSFLSLRNAPIIAPRPPTPPDSPSRRKPAAPAGLSLRMRRGFRTEILMTSAPSALRYRPRPLTVRTRPARGLEAAGTATAGPPLATSVRLALGEGRRGNKETYCCKAVKCTECRSACCSAGPEIQAAVGTAASSVRLRL